MFLVTTITIKRYARKLKPQYNGNVYLEIGEKKIRMLISENTDTDYCFTVQVGNKSLINRHKFEEFLNQTTSL